MHRRECWPSRKQVLPRKCCAEPSNPRFTLTFQSLISAQVSPDRSPRKAWTSRSASRRTDLLSLHVTHRVLYALPAISVMDIDSFDQ